MLKRELCFPRNKNNGEGKQNRRKPESEDISLYATLQEPEFRCFTLNS
jgi:hypothetical protein